MTPNIAATKARNDDDKQVERRRTWTQLLQPLGASLIFKGVKGGYL